ncbi:rSAM/selenodomain-associated transferase 2 [Methylohalomonas lacus]|uniref:RSAM/selenodomain-associated transferase 2 n=1 Tax=Methylohalomonas lacus TaxID=398773 RepID=A0AAE3HJP6_9GAMM|nr:TIGR04283 family arsenosugar biosynthesis glycosyltransferase [Methylohalomonas lacus]MCS3902371.1 rSAM/selenodomain-associated transferase 2 [Methylohalomonas lacus]
MPADSRPMPGQPVDDKVSVIMPVFNEAAGIEAALRALQPLREAGHEVIVVDGDSSDATVERAQGLADRTLAGERGRARQMNAGAAVARHPLLLFLHADTQLPPTALEDARHALATGYRWGRFDVRIEPADGILLLVAACMNLRSRLTGVATGDQAIFVTRQAFAAVGGYPELPLMEDLALSDRLKSIGPPACLRTRVLTSARRWQRHGRLRTILIMWRLRLAYRLGADPARLARDYYQ